MPRAESYGTIRMQSSSPQNSGLVGQLERAGWQGDDTALGGSVRHVVRVPDGHTVTRSLTHPLLSDHFFGHHFL